MSLSARPLADMSRAEKVAEAQRLRAGGLKLREIAEVMGVGRTTAGTWLEDPDLSKQRARRERYRGRCAKCGGKTTGSAGYRDKRSDRLCQDCRTWTKEMILDAMKRWADEHGGIPPTCTDWRHTGGADHPTADAVTGRFNWNEMLLAAGFALWMDRRPETQDWIEREIRAGRPVTAIAEQLGVSESAIWNRFQYRGQSVRKLRRAS